MFSHCNRLSSIDLSQLDTSKVTKMRGMFYGCSELRSIDVSQLDTSKVTNMQSMFSYCRELRSIDVSNFNTSKVTNMSDMFSACNELRSIDVSNFNIRNVTNMDAIFSYCPNCIKIIVPAYLRYSILLPYSDDDSYWLNEDEEICTEIAAGLRKSMTYIKIISGDSREDISKTKQEVTFEDNLIYNGKLQERTFDLVIQAGEKNLVEGTDYTYTVTRNKKTKAGDYKFRIFVTGEGDYTGSFTIEKDWKIAKAEKAPNMPENSRNVTIRDGLKVSDISLADNLGWQWVKGDRQIELPTKAGLTCEVTAEYVGDNAANYEMITQLITITMRVWISQVKMTIVVIQEMAIMAAALAVIIVIIILEIQETLQVVRQAEVMQEPKIQIVVR